MRYLPLLLLIFLLPLAQAQTSKRKTTPDAESPSATPKKRPTTSPTPASKKRSSSTPAAKARVDADPASNAVAEKAMDPAARPTATPSATPAPARKHAPSATLATSQLEEFSNQPPAIQKLITGALELAGRNLTYTFGSDDPARGGMDCSGAVSYLLRQQGLTNVPRDASSQYTWARQNGQFFAVISKQAGGLGFNDLRPGDLMFWSGTYDARRDPPVTHSMIFLGTEKGRNVPVMWGSSDGRSYQGQSRNGVSVFDFKMPRASGDDRAQADFLGYAHIPGLTAATARSGRQETTPASTPAPTPKATPGSGSSSSKKKKSAKQ